jgi:hypothetical protein
MVEGTGFPGQIQGRDPTSKAPQDVFIDEDTGTIYVALWTWNTGTTAWEKVANINSKLDTIIAHLAQIETNTTP